MLNCDHSSNAILIPPSRLVLCKSKVAWPTPTKSKLFGLSLSKVSKRASEKARNVTGHTNIHFSLRRGNSGNDTIESGGFNTLTGGSGVDEFLITSITPSVNATITDFESGTDKIVVGFSQLTPTENGSLDPSQFSIVDSDELVDSSSGFIVYSLGTGGLFFNQDGIEEGMGGSFQFATLQGDPTLAETDFRIA